MTWRDMASQDGLLSADCAPSEWDGFTAEQREFAQPAGAAHGLKRGLASVTF